MPLVCVFGTGGGEPAFVDQIRNGCPEVTKRACGDGAGNRDIVCLEAIMPAPGWRSGHVGLKDCRSQVVSLCQISLQSETLVECQECLQHLRLRPEPPRRADREDLLQKVGAELIKAHGATLRLRTAGSAQS